MKVGRSTIEVKRRRPSVAYQFIKDLAFLALIIVLSFIFCLAITGGI